jgi:hypothetical protein
VYDKSVNFRAGGTGGRTEGRLDGSGPADGDADASPVGNVDGQWPLALGDGDVLPGVEGLAVAGQAQRPLQ